MRAVLEPPAGAWSSLRALPRYLTPPAASAALVAALIAFTGPALLVFQAAANADLSSAELGSWLFAVYVGGGLGSLVLALTYRLPVCTAHPIAGAALLATALPGMPLSQAVGAYLVSGLLIALLGLSGLFGRVMAKVPPPIVQGMLAGVLFRFGLGIFTPLPEAPLLVLAMLAAYLVSQRLDWPSPTLLALLTGVVLAAIDGQFRLGEVELGLAWPQVYEPSFSLQAMLTLALPLTLLSLTSQNAPGIAILQSLGYRPPSNAITLVCGLGSMLMAPLAGHGLCIAAPMTAVCASPSVDPEKDARYGAAVVNGLLLIAFGLFGATATSLVRALPNAIIGVAAGLAMVPALLYALRGAVGQQQHLNGAFFALVIAASDVSMLGVGAAFWSLLGGLLVSRLQDQPAGATSPPVLRR